MPAVRAGAEWWPVVPVIVLPVPSDAECLFTSSPSAFLRWGEGASAQIAGPCLTGLFISSLSLESSLHPSEKRCVGSAACTFPPGPRLMLIFAQRPHEKMKRQNFNEVRFIIGFSRVTVYMLSVRAWTTLRPRRFLALFWF